MKRFMSFLPAILLFFLVSSVQSPVSRADVPRLIQYQGKLIQSGGAAVPGPVDIRVRLYDSPTAAGPVLFDETHSDVNLSRGLFSILIGAITPGGLPDAAIEPATVYLGVAIDGAAELAPRRRIATAPLALKARSAEQLVRPGTVSPAASVDAGGTVSVPERLAVGTASPAASAKLDVSSTNSGFLLPRMTSAERDVIANPATGLQIFNLDTNCLEFYIGGLWQSLVCGCSGPPAAPLAIAGPDTVCEADENVVYSITPIFGATSYTWSVPPGATIIAGDGTPSITVNYGSDSGSVIVSANNACGSSSDRAQPVTVNPEPDASFTRDPVYIGGPATFAATTSGATYSWTFDGGSPPTSISQNPTVTWVSGGTFEVSLTVTQAGCAATTTEFVEPGLAPASCEAILSATPGSPNGTYVIDPDAGGSLAPVQVYCDMTADGGGWTLVLLSSPYSTPPSPNYDAAVSGNTVMGTFGSDLTLFDQFLGARYWNALGNEMRLQMGSSPSSLSHAARYTFSLNEGDNYRLSMSNQQITIHTTGTAEPGMYTQHAASNCPLSTADRDNSGGGCSPQYGNTPWWYCSCWSGNFWGGGGGGGYQNAPYWTGSSGEYFAWGAIWVR